MGPGEAVEFLSRDRLTSPERGEGDEEFPADLVDSRPQVPDQIHRIGKRPASLEFPLPETRPLDLLRRLNLIREKRLGVGWLETVRSPGLGDSSEQLLLANRILGGRFAVPLRLRHLVHQPQPDRDQVEQPDRRGVGEGFRR